MMILRRLIGILVVMAAVVGIIFSVVGLIGIWRYRPAVTQTLTNNLTVFDQALNTTQDGLTIVGQVVQTTTVEVASLQTTTKALAVAIHDTNPMLASLVSLTGTDIPEAVSATQSSLASAQSSALLIDSVPLLPVAAYKPEVPLATALSQVSTSLEGLKPSLVTINTSLADGKKNLAVLEIELNKISDTTKGISNTLGRAQIVIDQYQTLTTQLKQRVEAAQAVIPSWSTKITWILSFVLGWLLITQVGLVVQGLDMLRGHRRAALETSD
jgi:hypothetical protein